MVNAIYLKVIFLSLGSNTEIYTPLTCELCTETFTIPADWVKHVQTHTDMLPAKRRRRDSPDVRLLYY